MTLTREQRIEEKQITAIQTWEECGDSKTGWEGSGWMVDGKPVPDNYELIIITDRDKFWNPTEAVFRPLPGY